MKRKFLVLSVLALAVVALTTADASAWGFWRYRMACRGPLFPRLAHRGHRYDCCRPYNAFTPGSGNCCNGGGRSFGLRGRLHGHGGGCSTCMGDTPFVQQNQTAQYIDPSLLPYMAQAAPAQMQAQMQMQPQMQMQMQMQMQPPMPIQPTAYQPYGLQPVNYAPAYYPAYQPYPYYYYPAQPAAPYGYGYGYGYGY
jgi:hypothetical protein